MPPVTSPFGNTQSLPFHVRVARISLISALIVLGLYATSVAWQQFGPKGKRAARPTGPVASTTVTAPTPSKTAAAQPAKQPSTTTTATTEPAVTTTEPGPNTTATPMDASPRRNVPTDVAVSTEPTPTVDATPAPDVSATNASATAPQPGSSLAPVLAATAAKVWWESRNSMGQSAGRAAQAIGQSALESLKHPVPATPSPQTTAQTDLPATPRTVEPTPEVKTASSTRVLVVNPATTGGVIHYLVNGATYSLYPGQMHELDGGQTLRLEYHRGANFGDARQSLTPGRYEFQVTADGWKLVEQTGDGQF